MFNHIIDVGWVNYIVRQWLTSESRISNALLDKDIWMHSMVKGIRIEVVVVCHTELFDVIYQFRVVSISPNHTREKWPLSVVPRGRNWVQGASARGRTKELEGTCRIEEGKIVCLVTR